MDVRTGRRPVAAKPQNSWGKCVGGGSDAPLARRSLGEGGEDDDKEWRQRRAFLATRSEIAFHLCRRH